MMIAIKSLSIRRNRRSSKRRPARAFQGSARAVLALCSILLLSVAAVAADKEAVTTAVSRLLLHKNLEGASIGIEIREVESGDVLFSRNPHSALIVASNNKLVSTASALFHLGEDFKFDQSAFFARGKVYVAQTDLTLMAVGFRENLMLGVDVARSIGGAGAWMEAAHVFADALNDDSPDARDYFRGSIGCDYSFENNTYVFVEYHFNQAGGDRLPV